METSPRFDFTGGLNLAFSQEVLDRREVRYAGNLRHGEIGSMVTRKGTRRIHSDVLGGGDPVTGIVAWEGPSGVQLVAVSGGNLYYKTLAATTWTLGGSGLHGSRTPKFARHVISGTPTLFIADGTLHTWSGTVLGTAAGTPPAAVGIEVYKTRVFAFVDGRDDLYYSRIENPQHWTAPLGGSGKIQTYDTDPIVALKKVGSSLLPFKQNTVARFTGVTSQNIRIDQETDGVSDELGLLAVDTLVSLERRAFGLTARGPYLFSDVKPDPCGIKVEKGFLAWNKEEWDHAVAVRHKGRQEVWAFGPSAGETENDQGYIYNDRIDSWTGPWSFEGFNVRSACEYKRADGTDSVLIGGYDGFVRDADTEEVDAQDDVAVGLTEGGTPFTWRLTLPELLFGYPRRTKLMTVDSELQMDLGLGGFAQVVTSSEEMDAVIAEIDSRGSGVMPYYVNSGVQGQRITMYVEGSSGVAAQINGITPAAELGRSGR